MICACQRDGSPVCSLLPSLMVAVVLGCGPSNTPANNPAANNLPDSTIWHAKANIDGSQLLYAHSKNVVGLWHADTLKTTWLKPWANSVMFLSFIPNGAHLIVAGTLPKNDSTKRSDVRLVFYGSKNARVEQYVNLPASTSHILCANEDWIVLSSTENSLRHDEPARYSINVWRHRDNQWDYSHKFSKLSENDVVKFAQFFDNNRIVTYVSHCDTGADEGQWRKEIMIVDLDTKQILRRAVTNIKPGAMSVSEGGKYVAVGDFKAVEVYDTSSLTRQGKSSVLDVVADCPRVAVSCDGRYVAYASASLEVRDLRANAVVLRDKSYEDIVRSKANLAELCKDEAIQRFPAGNDAWLRGEFCYGYIDFVDASKKLVGITRAGNLRIWDVAKWRLLAAERLSAPHSLKEIEEAIVDQPRGTENGD